MSNQIHIPKNDWEDPRSYLSPKVGAKEGYEGVLYHNNAEFSFSLSKQKSGKYLYRGRVSALGADGRIMKYAEAQTGEQSPAAQKEYPSSTECYCNKDDEEAIQKAVLGKAIELYVHHMPQILRAMRESTHPNEITPAIAALLYLNRFFDVNYKDASEDTIKHYQWAIQKHFSQLPNIPMAKYKPSMISRYFKENVVGSHARKLMKHFWQFLILRGYCTGSEDPFPVDEKRKISPQARQRESLRQDTLSLEEQDDLFESIMSKDAVTGGDCGIALSLWGDFHLDDGLCWQDVLFDEQDIYLVLINYHRKDLAGATHDFTRPPFPQAAIILHRRYSELRSKYSARELAKYPIISQEKNPAKAMSADALRGYIGLALRRIGVSEATFAALKDEKIAVSRLLLANSYVHNVTQRAGFQDVYGVANFLQGLSLRGSVTEDHYLSHTDPDAIEFMHTGQMAMQPLRFFMQDDTPHTMENGDTEYVLFPEHSRQALGVIGALVLPPGELADFKIPHGVLGNLRMREVKEDGSKRRKSGKRVKADKSETPAIGGDGETPQTTEPSLEDEAPPCSDQQESATPEQPVSQVVDNPIPPQLAERPRAQGKQRAPKKEPLIEGQDSFF